MGFPTLRRRPHKLPAHTVKDHSSTRKLPPQLAAQSISPQRAAHLTPLSSSVNTLNLPLHTSPPPPTHFLSSGPRIIRARSDEHTSELQSLMRISYAVFFLK